MPVLSYCYVLIRNLPRYTKIALYLEREVALNPPFCAVDLHNLLSFTNFQRNIFNVTYVNLCRILNTHRLDGYVTQPRV
jgi:hypothetical protein